MERAAILRDHSAWTAPWLRPSSLAGRGDRTRPRAFTTGATSASRKNRSAGQPLGNLFPWKPRSSPPNCCNRPRDFRSLAPRLPRAAHSQAEGRRFEPGFPLQVNQGVPLLHGTPWRFQTRFQKWLGRCADTCGVGVFWRSSAPRACIALDVDTTRAPARCGTAMPAYRTFFLSRYPE